ncbi:YlqD family protein [Bacillus sp. CGMCC 1.16607]|uniref:YlqD family protein n=1 Tax=Bacillus sp. CGMCC 1.16607 TaxID=3351842 RepID=UPI00363B1B40
MKILQTVVVKQVLTEKSKKELLEKFEANIFQIKKECEQLQFEQKKLEKNSKLPPINVRKHFENEIQERLNKINLLTFQIEQLHLLPLGSEIKEREVQAIVEVEVGDHWEEKWNRSEIIVLDGIIQEMR